MYPSTVKTRQSNVCDQIFTDSSFVRLLSHTYTTFIMPYLTDNKMKRTHKENKEETHWLTKNTIILTTKLTHKPTLASIQSLTHS